MEILNQVRDAIIVCDMDDRVLFWNRGAQSLYGHSAEQALGRSAAELLFPQQQELWEAGRETTLKEGVYLAEVRQPRQDGNDLIVEHRRSLIHDDDGKPAAQLILHIDITARKREEAHQRRSQRLESVGTLAGGIAHDLNNVLTPILMSAKLLKRGSNNQPRLLDAIVTSAERGGHMIKKLLAFAGGEQGQQQQIDVREIMLEAEEILSHTLPKSIDLQVRCDQNLHSVVGDATELSQILMNLAINARDAMPSGGRLELKAENFRVDPQRAARSDILKSGPHVLITVSDTGTGIPREIVDRIFDPFFTTKKQGQGTGLGLATTLGIVRSHGGDISVYTEPGNGTLFSILLPSAHSSEAPAAPEESEELPSGHGEMILLVDDEPLILEMARNTLEASGYRVTAAGGGAEAIAVYQHNSENIDLVLLDMMMPGMDGFATKDGLRDRSPSADYRQQRPAPSQQRRRTPGRRRWIPSQTLFRSAVAADRAQGAGRCPDIDDGRGHLHRSA